MSVTLYDNKGEPFLIDVEDFERVGLHKWQSMPRGYLRRTAKKKGQPDRTVLLHRIVMNAPEGADVDHVNGDRRDNRKANLRLCTRSQNLGNQGAQKRNALGIKGVSRCSRSGMYVAFIQCGDTKKNLGRFQTPEEAHDAYCKAAKSLFGEFWSPG